MMYTEDLCFIHLGQSMSEQIYIALNS